jgi:Ca2+-binding RTX toxin-like protein
VRIGDAGMGFTVIGINGNGAIEKAAIYLQGNHDEIDIEGNRVTANGDAGLTTEFAAAVTDLRIDGNIFDGQTFEGVAPSGTGFSTQFDVGNNVPRQLVVIGNGGGGAGPANYPTKNVFFTNNEVVGTAGGVNGGGEQGNSLVTIDADTSVISGNSFTGFTNYTGVALRARGPNTSIENNTIDHDVNGSESNGFFVNNKGFPATYAGNVIDGGAANETLGGTPGDDSISGDAGTDGLAGGLGTDTAQYAQAITTAMLAESGGNWTVTTGGAEGTDTLNDMEIVDGAEAGKILLVGSGGFATIQEAVDAADAGDTIMVGAGTFAGATITKELTIVGSGIGNTIITSGLGSAGFDLSGDIDATSAGSATVTISGFTFTGNSVGVRGASSIELDHLVVQNSHFEQNKIHGIGTGSGAFGLGDVQILDSSFVRNGDGSGNGDGDIVLFGFTGDALIQNVTIEGGVNAVPTSANADSAIQINGRNPSTYDVVDPIGNVVFDNVDVSGSYAKVIVYIQGYTNLDGLVFDANGTTIDGHAGWGYGLYIDTTGGVSTSALPAGVVDGVQGFFDDAAAGALAPNSVDLTNVTLGNDIAINVAPGHPYYAVNGQAFDSVLVGTPVADDFLGSAGRDLLIGGAGNDTLAGAGGNDAYFIDGGETLVEGAAGGTDTVYSTVTHTLAANFENLTLLGTADIDGTGNGDANVITGNTGNNVLAGLAGADTLNGGDGTDTADYSASAASVSVSLASGVGIGGDANGDQLSDIENLIGSAGADNLVGDDGDNVFAGLAGADTISGGDGSDTIDYSASTNQITIDLSTLIGGFVRPTGGHAAGDRLIGIENVIGSSSTDQITGDANANMLIGGNGNDSLNGLGGDDTMDGGDGNDTFTVDSTNDVIIDSSGIDLVNSFATYTLAEGLEKLTLLSGADLDGTGNSGDNTIKGNSGANELFGLGGKDAITGGGGNDTIDGGEGNDNLNGNGGDDSIIGGLGVDKLRGEAGNDTIDGGDDNDQLYGGDDNDQLDGGGGVDQLFGEGGDDVLNGGIGNDKLDGGTGADTMDGDEGNDTYTVDDVNDVVSETISGIPGGKDVVKSSAATFTLGANIETLNLTGSGDINGIGNDEDNAIAGNSGHNLIQGGGGIDKISAGGGNDTVEGGSGNDAIKGQGGNDTLYGDGGNDQITGGDGTDDMWGGVGNDKFIFGSAAEAGNGVSRDVIMDFESVDVVNLRAIDAIDGGSDNAFTFIATGAFTAAGQLRYYDDGSGNTIIEGNTDGNAATAEFQIELRGYTGGLVLNDLIL